ncbi:MAG: hypothetical protein REI64_13960 [Pedobacter sp.]|uniref:hypothetical protein n=1 Tax=Pedobacter sp. TaxID=1411316 RepID=UPI002807131A|nr:hypothetical protein [Pedobacter sp.]MDQ8005903.1 hypothetical protein [Pedobacter sp.]
MENQDQYNSEQQGDHVDKQIENAKAEMDQTKEATPRVEIRSQENVLSGLSDKEREQAAELDLQALDHSGNDMDTSASGTVSGGLSEKERADAAEADGKIGDENKGGLSERERRDAADESW